VIRSAFFPDVDIFSSARTVVILTSNVDFFLAKVVSWRLEGGVLPFPSDALWLFRKLYLGLDMSSGGFCDVAPVRRRKKADGNRYAGVKVQVDD